MKPPPFAYECPRDAAEAVALLAAHGAEARPLAGGQSLVPLLNFRLARPALLVDLNRIASLARVARAAGQLRIGAMARQAAVEADPAVARGWPILTEAIGHIAHSQIRNRGTVGGSLAHNDPAAELPAVMLALDAEMTAQGPEGVRTVGARDFFVDTMETALAADELLTEIRVPALPEGTGWSFHETARRQGDFALAALARAADPINTLAPGVAPGLRAADYFRSPDGAFASGVHGVVAVVDTATGMVEIEKYVVVHDCGVMINPAIVDGQILGGTAQGIGGAFYEKLAFDEDGQPLTTTFMDYLIPTAMEIPPIEIHHMESRSSLNPLGVKGVGEGGAIPAAAAFAGAVEDALEPFGATVRAVPLSPPAVLALIEGRAGGDAIL